MGTFPRSSDSYTDLDHAITLRELEELTAWEKEYQSPPPLPLPSSSSSSSSLSITTLADRGDRAGGGQGGRPVHAKTVNDTQASTRSDVTRTTFANRPPPSSSYAHLSPGSGSDSRTPQDAAETEKLLIFRDDAANNPRSAPVRGTRGQDQKKKSVKQIGQVQIRPRDVREHPQAKSDPEVPRTRRDEDDRGEGITANEITVQNYVTQLQAIALERGQLLRKLDHLNKQEQGILTSLRHVYRSATCYPFQDENATWTSETLPIEWRVQQEKFPLPDTASTPSVPMAKPLGNASRSSKPPGRRPSRPVSAPPPPPPPSRPTSNSSTSSIKRVPLADKIDAYKDTVSPLDDSCAIPRPQSLPIKSSPHATATTSKSSHLEDRANRNRSVNATPVYRNRYVRVPTKFGDEDHTNNNHSRGIVASTPNTKTAESTAPTITPKFAKSTKPATIRSPQRPRDKVPTPASEAKKGYAVPPTVARKRWAF